MLDATAPVMLMPTLARYMTRKPWTIARNATMAEAHRVMREHEIRHLPVVDGTRIVGIVTMHDLHLLETLPGVSQDEVEVEEAMSSEVFAVSEHDELAGVVERMAQAKLGSAVVMGHSGLIGIFTSIDALRALADILRREAA
jgi:acetoin utilization protein AcuB